MDNELMTLISKLDKYRELSKSNNAFTFKQSDYDNYILYKAKVKEYAQANGWKVDIKFKKSDFIPMSDFTEQLEEYQF
jgi:hypothetical protein